MRSRPLNVVKPIDYFCHALARALENAIGECSSTLIPRRVQRAKFTKAATYWEQFIARQLLLSGRGQHATNTADRAQSALPSAQELRAALCHYSFVPQAVIR